MFNGVFDFDGDGDYSEAEETFLEYEIFSEVADEYDGESEERD